MPGPSPHEDPEQGHNLPSPIDQPALNVKPHSSRCSARSPPLTPSLAHDLLSGDTTALMTRFGSCSTGFLGLGRWNLWISSWKVTVDEDHSFYIPSTLFTSFSLQGYSDMEVVTHFLFTEWQIRNILIRFPKFLLMYSSLPGRRCLCELRTYFVLQCLLAQHFR